MIQKEIESLTNPSGRTNLANVDEITQAAATLGRLGGFAKSRKKIAAAKKNGKKGGRPKGSKSKKSRQETVGA